MNKSLTSALKEKNSKETDNCKDYNLVYLSGVFHHFEEPFSALGNICDSINDKCWFSEDI